jgi:hypothetical protein
MGNELTGMNVADLLALAATEGVPIVEGATKKEIIAAITDKRAAAPPPAAGAGMPAAPQGTVAVYQSKRERIKAHLDAQPKVRMMIPKTPGGAPDYQVTINGYTTVVETGKTVELPEQIAQMLTERLESEGILERRSAADVAKLTGEGLI